MLFFDIQIIIFFSVQTCASNCSLHGNCEGTCVCFQNFSGDACETMVVPLRVGQSMNGYLESGSWNYYHINASSEQNLIISLHSPPDGGDCDLLVKKGQNPTISVFDYGNFETTKDSNITVNQPGQSMWYIGIFGWSSCSYTLNTALSGGCNCLHGSCNSDGSLKKTILKLFFFCILIFHF